ncbi:hypothetical protein OJ997_15020 [Solirubrobacter phytolaccae]|uniref:Uncharacterized protein n=1 Tax=Solirubrobacter phytolaccae TaxID=1404360 RepID=A0A9X3N802_9ACTN|nr:hypothetical protein [Solirubrobacter phytolaccae]MDA0181615.1 hypothetical protein [Solirubrobacter phytolaccae]
MLLIAGLLVFLHWAVGNVTCGWDTSYCAESAEKDTTYQGVLETRDGRVLADTDFTVRFESRVGEPDVGGFSTDADGRYCLMWASEPVSPGAYVGDEYVNRLERLGEDDVPVEPCQTSDASLPWNRTEEVTRTPQFLAAFIPGGLAILVLLVGVFRPTRALFALGSVLTAATFALLGVLWFM